MSSDSTKICRFQTRIGVMLSFVNRFNSINLGYFIHTMTALWAGINLCSSAEISTSTIVQSGLYKALTEIPTPNSTD